MKSMESRIIFRVHPRVEQRVNELVERLGMMKSEVVRRAIVIGLDILEARADRNEKRRRGPKGRSGSAT